VVEGLPDDVGDVPCVQVKAFQASEAVQARREMLNGGDLSCRFPTSVDSLGVYPDLPWVYLDSSTRTRLGLAGQKLGVVRLRASRGYQIGKELRELLLVLAIAFLGVVSIIDDQVLRLLVLGLLVLFVIVVVVVRLRSRLSRHLRRRSR
jgi:hypothetical protein